MVESIAEIVTTQFGFVANDKGNLPEMDLTVQVLLAKLASNGAGRA
jgi:hypothetical protein